VSGENEGPELREVRANFENRENSCETQQP